MSVYLAIAVASVALLLFRNPVSVATLLSLQVLYKLTTPFTVGTMENPVVQANLWISACHCVTLFAIFRKVGSPYSS